MNKINQWITDNYENILLWARNASQQHGDWEDLAHYAIATLLEHEKAEELVEKGGARWFIVRIMLNSSRGKKSAFYRLYRPPYNEWQPHHDTEDTPYDNDIDKIAEVIHGILEDLSHGDSSEWFMATITELCLQQDKINFSKLARETGIPRTSIANTYRETIEFIQLKLKEYGNLDPDLRLSISNLLNNAN